MKKQGIKSIVLDPFLDPEWQADFITNNPNRFLETVWNSTGCAVFVDEAASTVGKYNPIMDELALRGRHWGHKCYFISQRVKQISTSVRTQCSELVIFKQARNDTKDLADEFVEPQILEADTLEKGEFLYIRDAQAPIKLNVFEI